MTYQRMRNRNNLMFRKPEDDPDPYSRLPGEIPEYVNSILVGDMNRMEQDYMNPQYPKAPFATAWDRSSPAERCADATAVDLKIVRKVLGYVFFDQL